MKKTTIFLLATLFSSILFGQTETETIKKANALIKNKKYETAFRLLQEFDPNNWKPDIVLLKENIALNYFVTSIMHQMFAFKDLAKEEDVMDYRGKEGSFGMYRFFIHEILDSLIKVYPDNYQLYRGLGDFYYEVHLKYDNNWMEKDLLNLMEINYTKAIDNHAGDYQSYYVMGYIKTSKEKYKEAIPYFLKSIELNSTAENASGYYNLAYAYLYMNDRENALKYAKSSLDLYKDKSFKGDAARMIAVIYSELKDDKTAIMYYEKADEIDPGNYYTLRPLLHLYVKTGNTKAKEELNSFFNLSPANPTIYNDLSNIYTSNKKDNELIAFYQTQIKKFSGDKKVLGSLYFYLGQMQMDKDKPASKENFLKAKEIFSSIFEKDHQVFSVIDKALNELQ